MSDVSEAARQMGRKGGKSRTAAKKAASRENGKLGGRPMKATYTVMADDYLNKSRRFEVVTVTTKKQAFIEAGKAVALGKTGVCVRRNNEDGTYDLVK